MHWREYVYYKLTRAIMRGDTVDAYFLTRQLVAACR